jgi:Polyketide cyclase / dehydrase and lipid transport
MASVDVSVDSDLTPRQAWALASDLSRFGEWMTIFGGWKSDVPAQVELGTKVSSLIKVKGFRNIIHWEVTNFDLYKRLELRGSGRGGVHIALDMSVTDTDPGSIFHLIATLSGGLLNGPVGSLVAKVIESDVRRSVENLAALRPV